jgi:hypothetical protein
VQSPYSPALVPTHLENATSKLDEIATCRPGRAWWSAIGFLATQGDAEIDLVHARLNRGARSARTGAPATLTGPRTSSAMRHAPCATRDVP